MNENTASVMTSLTEDILVCAHTHIPSVKEFGSKLFVNCGSVGKPKNRTPDSSYCILDIDRDGTAKALIKQVSYDYKKTVKDMTMLNFPTSLVRSFEDGTE